MASGLGDRHMNPVGTLPSRRALACAAVTYLVVVAAMTAPRVAGPSWRSIMGPKDMRNLEGLPIQWEAYLILRSLHAMSTSVVPGDVIDWYSTDEYRATLPIYHSSVVTLLTRSHVAGVTASEVWWWWLGALAVFVFARNFASTLVAFCAGLLTCLSPLGVGHIGAAHLHTASSLSLSVLLSVSWRILNNNTLSIFSKSILYGSCIFLSSVTYTYQWFLIPFCLVASNAPRLSRHRIIANLGGIAWFLALRWVSYGLLAVGGLAVHSHPNDPLRVVLDRIGHGEMPTGIMDALFGLYSFVLYETNQFFQVSMSSYHVYVVVLAFAGAATTRRTPLQAAATATGLLTLALSPVYNIPWVIMSGYPVVYLLAAQGIVHASRAAIRILAPPPLREGAHAPIIMTVILVAMIGALTNLDLVGDADFVRRWWPSWYGPW